MMNKSINLLIKSSILGFIPSTEFLCLILLKRFFSKQENKNKLIDDEIIKQYLSEFFKEENDITYLIIEIVQKQQLYDQSIIEYCYKEYEETEFIYDMFLHPIYFKDLLNEEYSITEDSYEEINITKVFFEGFGYDIYQKQ